MAEKSFVLLSLKDDKAKKLSKALSNVTCRKILDYLASKGDATETQISKELKLPISTVNYNMKILADNGLVTMDEYHYSEKGKEVTHYKMRNRYIVIAPDEEDETSIMKKLKGMLPAVIILGIGTFLVGLVQLFIRGSSTSSNVMMKTMSNEMQDSAGTIAPMMSELATRSAPITSSDPHYALWFFFGGVFVMIGLLLWNFAKK